jgi:hypothetical protein
MLKNKSYKVYWTMKDGRKIDIDKMSIKHLRNILKMIIRNSHIEHAIIDDSYDIGTYDPEFWKY